MPGFNTPGGTPPGENLGLAGPDITLDDFAGGNLAGNPTGSGSPPTPPPGGTPQPPPPELPDVPPPPPVGVLTGQIRFYSSPAWRFIVTDLNTVTLTFLDRIAHDKQVVIYLGQADTMTGIVPSDDPEVNILHDDGYPFVNEGNRLIYGLRREGVPGNYVYFPRFAGPILGLEDSGDPDIAASTITAYSPRQYLYRRPVLNDLCADGATPPGVDCLQPEERYVFPGPNGAKGAGPTSLQAVELLRRSIALHGGTYIDAGEDWGGTPYWEGVIEETEEMVMDYARGMTVGEAWDMLEQTNTMEIQLTPIYDPANRPGYCAELSIRERVGQLAPSAVMAWDRTFRSLSTIDRTIDGTSRANAIQFYTANGVRAGIDGEPVTDDDSIGLYGYYWAQQTFPAQRSKAVLLGLMNKVLNLQKNGQTTLVLGPTPESAPLPLQEYGPGDTIPVYASARFRDALALTVDDVQAVRVHAIPITITDERTERVEQLIVTPDGAEVES